MLERKIYPSLDIMKFIMAMLILTQHTCNEWALYWTYTRLLWIRQLCCSILFYLFRFLVLFKIEYA